MGKNILIKFEHTEELLSNKTGLLLIDEFWKRHHIGELIDEIFGLPGSNRGIKSSLYVKSIIEMIFSNGSHLEDIKKLESDTGLKELTGTKKYPTSDATGDWLRVKGEKGCESKLWEVSRILFENLGEEETLDIDSTIIKADKGDGEMSYKGITGYHPLIGFTTGNSICSGSKFRYGNESAAAGLLDFTKECLENLGKGIKIIRIDSAGYQSEIMNYCFDTDRYFSITADHDSAVMETISKIEKTQWIQGKNNDGDFEDWMVAETVHTTNKSNKSFRLVVKRIKNKDQLSIFDTNEYSYWIIASNLPQDKYSSNDVILFHQKRGELERLIGEIKHYFNLDHMPCGQFSANSMYFTIGLFAYNILQLMKLTSLDPYWKNKSIRTIRYKLFDLPSKIIKSSRYLVAKIAAPLEYYEYFVRCFNLIRFAPT
jgi:hypothetical protein